MWYVFNRDFHHKIHLNKITAAHPGKKETETDF